MRDQGLLSKGDVSKLFLNLEALAELNAKFLAVCALAFCCLVPLLCVQGMDPLCAAARVGSLHLCLWAHANGHMRVYEWRH